MLLDVGDLLVEVGLGVGDDEVDAACGGLVPDRLGFGDAERVGLLLGLGEADGGTAEVDGLDARAAVLVVAAVLPGRRGDLLADPARGAPGRGALGAAASLPAGSEPSVVAKLWLPHAAATTNRLAASAA